MSKRNVTPVEIEIDGDYESRVNALGNMSPGSVNDFAIEPARPERTQQRQALVLPERRDSVYAITPGEAAMLGQAGQVAGAIIQTPGQHVNSADARQVDSAITRDKASLLYSGAYGVAALIVTVGLLLIVYMFRGGNLGGYFFTGLILWGVALLAILYYNRGQGLHHSPSGIAHHEIDARVTEAEIRADVAKHAIDAHVALLRDKWALEDKHRG